MWNELQDMMREAGSALKNDDIKIAENALKREERINRFQIELRQSHVDRLNNGKCQLKSGIVFLDLVDNLEKIGDHLSNIANGVVGGMRWQVE